MQFKDYYATLGVERGASEDEIKRAFRKLARKHHPDVSKATDAAARMQELNEAYDVLRDPEKRAAYDQIGQGRQGGQEFSPPPGWDAGFEFSGAPGGGADFGAHSDFFEALFGAAQRGGGRARHGGAARGEDHHARIMIPLEDAFHGATRTLTLRSPELDASGHVVLRERQLSVKIPKGIRAGQQIRLTGQGTPGFGGAAAGDLYLEVQFEPHRRYRVDGRDIFLTLRVAPWEAALGAAVPVRTPEGAVELNVPAGSQGGRKLRLRGRGIPGNPPGDLYAVLEIVLPAATGDKARALYTQMATELAFDPRAQDLEAP
ncbi:MAG: DnaJ domain-containing protein [Ideonella sp.]|nr:DnaJ domain-containing protein [Ideonella sp.]